MRPESGSTAVLRKEYEELAEALMDPAVHQNVARYRKLVRRSKDIAARLSLAEQCDAADREIAELEGIVSGGQEDDEEFVSLALQEIASLKERRDRLAREMERAVEERESRGPESLIMEIRAGTGGDEASLFGADLFRMYSRFAEERGWTVEVMDSRPTSVGGFKEVVFSVAGDGAYRYLRHEAGTHRVQRVPATETSGRIHTSTVTVAALAEAEEVEVEVSSDDLRVETFRASGPGGQHVNVTDSAVRITHIPTGLVVQSQEERSQHKNKAKAMRVLRARLLEQARADQDRRRRNERREQVGTGERSGKVRTYNFPQARVTDHRIGKSLRRLSDIMDGRLDELVEALEELLGRQGDD